MLTSFLYSVKSNNFVLPASLSETNIRSFVNVCTSTKNLKLSVKLHRRAH